eukprot:626238-Amorphochlora_amoeboformis.AAC.2
MDAFGIAALADLLREEVLRSMRRTTPRFVLGLAMGPSEHVSLDNVRKLYGPGKEKKEGYEKPFKAVVKGNEAK